MTRGDGSETIPAEVYANGKRVGYKLFTFGWSPGETYTHKTFYWNTRGMKPGEYTIKGEAYLWGDTSPFDNSLSVKQPLELAAVGAPFPGGKMAGGSATAGEGSFGKAVLRVPNPAAASTVRNSY